MSYAITKLDGAKLHRLRIRIRAQRYRAELIAELFPGKAAKRYIAYLKALQGKLGAIHDLEIGLEFISRLTTTSRLNGARSRLERHCAARHRKYVSRLQDPRHLHATLKPFWT